ncbi:unnamed protein product [Moneuplotes crassus]|uniref:Uncharacterized protein n=1 Tax=Euplotes crassus TaxID=5936 RepID=A0AAD2D3Z1_EUPCR|nr:unnamed protein product [Moneuplotes crassus]
MPLIVIKQQPLTFETDSKDLASVLLFLCSLILDHTLNSSPISNRNRPSILIFTPIN